MNLRRDAFVARTGQIMRSALAALFIVIMEVPPPLSAEAPVVARAPVWVYIEKVPGRFDGVTLPVNPPARELDELSRFILGGMVFGWNFSYTPADASRKVAERFSLEPIKAIDERDPRFRIVEVSADFPRLNCWAEFTYDEATLRRQIYWDSVVFKSAQGRGRGSLNDGMGGISEAYANALKLAVRAYARKIEKNKPKEIRGEALLRETPRLFADEGSFVAEVRVILNVTDMVPYSVY